MKILFIANRFPYPPYRGDKLKIYNLARQLYKKHDLYLITFIQDKSDYQYIEQLNVFFKEIRIIYLPKYLSVLKCIVNLFSQKPFQVIYFKSKKFEKLLNSFISETEFDVIHTQHLRMSQYSHNLSGVKRILDLPDAYSLYWKRRSNLKMNIFQKIFDSYEYKKILNYEKIIKLFDLNLVCSDEDKSVLVSTHKIDNINILPNGVDISTFACGEHDYSIKDRIIFTGNMDYSPNVDAVIYFTKEIFPEIIKKFPEVKFYIVGQKPVKKVLDLQSENVIVTGFVESISDEYNRSSVAVSPIRFGAGTLNKVLEPMSMGIPVVSTEIGFKGLGINSGEGVILANSREEFTKTVIQLLESKVMRETVGKQGIKVIENNFSWVSISKKLEGYFESLVNK